MAEPLTNREAEEHVGKDPFASPALVAAMREYGAWLDSFDPWTIDDDGTVCA